jgi:hypothetical protein
VFVTSVYGGAQLLRMRRPTDWDWARRCALDECSANCASVYGWWEAGAATMIGWRAACSRKHALAIWRKELDPVASTVAGPALPTA